MYNSEPVAWAFPDIELLTRHAHVEEEGILTCPKASSVTIFCERKDIYQRIRAAVHEQFQPTTVYQHILDDRMADCVWRDERYASFETTALNLQIQRQWDNTNPLVPTESPGAHALLAWLTMAPAQRESLQGALDLLPAEPAPPQDPNPIQSIGEPTETSPAPANAHAASNAPPLAQPTPVFEGTNPPRDNRESAGQSHRPASPRKPIPDFEGTNPPAPRKPTICHGYPRSRLTG